MGFDIQWYAYTHNAQIKIHCNCDYATHQTFSRVSTIDTMDDSPQARPRNTKPAWIPPTPPTHRAGKDPTMGAHTKANTKVDTQASQPLARTTLSHRRMEPRNVSRSDTSKGGYTSRCRREGEEAHPKRRIHSRSKDRRSNLPMRHHHQSVAFWRPGCS